MNKVWRDGALLVVAVIICAIGARVLNSGESLAEYAANNPETAYGVEEEVESSSQEGQTSNSETDEGSAGDTESVESRDSTGQVEYNAKTSSDSNENAEIVANQVDQEGIGQNGGTVVQSTQTESTQSETNNAKENASVARTFANVENLYIYRDGFTAQSIPDEIYEEMLGNSLPSEEQIDDIEIDIADLRYLQMMYIDFDGSEQRGEMIVNKEIAEDVLEIFAALYDAGYEIEKMQLIDAYGGDDDASMEDNNTSAFNYRKVAGTSRLSNHAYGLAIDINPLYNPAVIFNNDGTQEVQPATGEAYTDRSQNFPYKITTEDLAYRLFIEHGFTWGGNWNSKKDYQHFEKK